MFTSNILRRVLPALCVGTLLGWHASSQAALTLSTTRVIFDGERRGTSLIIANPGKDTFAVQAWVNTAQDDTTTAVPFVVTPHLFRLDPTRQQQVQINGLPNELPADRESLFYFNVQEIPQLDPDQKNVLAVALRTRVKFFYRPKALKSGPAHEQNALTWSLVTAAGKTRLAVHNPTPYHVTFSGLRLLSQDDQQSIPTVEMVAPLSDQYYDLPRRLAGPLQVEFTTLNDYGGNSPLVKLPVAIPE
jgi:chaperone protein EcpD